MNKLGWTILFLALNPGLLLGQAQKNVDLVGRLVYQVDSGVSRNVYT